MRWIALPLSLAIVMGACGESGPREDPASEAAIDSVDMAMEVYDAAMFDTISWDSAGAAVERGRVVFSFSCQKCHGHTGRGDAGFVSQSDTLTPPSFIDPEWRFAGDKEGIREQVFVGTAEGMPHWGMVGLKPRDIDAVATFVLRGLRSEGQ
jgi:mono/diheme cytochrome c family protein